MWIVCVDYPDLSCMYFSACLIPCGASVQRMYTYSICVYLMIQCICLLMYVCVCSRQCVYAQIRVCDSVCMCTCMHSWNSVLHQLVHTHEHLSAYMCVYIYIWICLYTYLLTCLPSYLSMCLFVHLSIDVRMCLWHVEESANRDWTCRMPASSQTPSLETKRMPTQINR